MGDADGLNAAAAGPVSLISLSDAAFATVSSDGNKYVNLLVVSLPNFPAAGQPSGTPSTNVGEITPFPHVQNYPEQYWPSSSITGPEKLVCGTSTPAPVINFVGTQFSIPVDNSNFAGSPLHCKLKASLNSCSQIFAQPTQGSGNAAGNWQPGLPLTIEGSGFGTLPVINLPYATTGWSSTAYLTIQDLNSQNQVNWSSPSLSSNSKCQMYILKWSDTSITVVPNVETTAVNGMGTSLSPLTETNPLSLVASTKCVVIAGDRIQVTVINPQSPTGPPASLPHPVTVGTFTGSLN